MTDVTWAFPEVDAGAEPLGDKVLVQMKRIKKTTASGLLIVNDTKEAEKWNTQIAKVIAVGPLAFKNRDTLLPWPEGVWAEVGDFVRIPKWGGDRWEIPVEGEEEPALFCIFRDVELIARIKGDPMKIRAYLI